MISQHAHAFNAGVNGFLMKNVSSEVSGINM